MSQWVEWLVVSDDMGVMINWKTLNHPFHSSTYLIRSCWACFEFAHKLCDSNDKLLLRTMRESVSVFPSIKVTLNLIVCMQFASQKKIVTIINVKDTTSKLNRSQMFNEFASKGEHHHLHTKKILITAHDFLRLTPFLIQKLIERNNETTWKHKLSRENESFWSTVECHGKIINKRDWKYFICLLATVMIDLSHYL